MSLSVALNFADGKTVFISSNHNELLLDAAIRQRITLLLDCPEGVCELIDAVKNWLDVHDIYHGNVYSGKFISSK